MTLNISFANRLCALWFVLGLIWRSPTGAAGEDLYVSASSGSDSSSCNESFPCLSLGYALAQASPSSSIFVLPGIYSGNENSNLCEDGTCAYDIKIEGLGLPEEIVLQNTLLGASSRAFYINNNDITSINNITITGFVYTNILEGNVGGGGAIYISNTDISLSNLILANNSAQSGGALSVYLSNTTIDGCQFLANFAIDHGGAFSSYSSAIVVSNSLFADNNATSQTFTGIGGAIYYLEPRGKRTMTIFNSAFVRNFATRAGGAVYVESVANTAEAFSAFYTKFDGNSVLGTETCNSASACSSRGGALYLLAVGAIIVDCVFDHNTALVRTETDVSFVTLIYLSLTYLKLLRVLEEVRSTRSILMEDNFNRSLLLSATVRLQIIWQLVMEVPFLL